jgi:hypothetical protein
VTSKGWRALSGANLALALLQSLCTAVLTISGVRVAIGLSSLAAASGIYAPARGWHQDAIRIPMLWIATIGALVNLAVLAWIRHLRSRPAAQWRRCGRIPWCIGPGRRLAHDHVSATRWVEPVWIANCRQRKEASDGA